ncbi:MAG: ComEC/Rec2 family competence protein [Candidatus Parcubacteria bacterium]|nr:ComEC/Rec2 family competence protein [Candidatus Parcubacteria bacterium]
MSASNSFFIVLLSFIAGVFLNSIISNPLPVLLAFFVPGIILVFIFRREKTILVGFCFLFLLAGVLRHQAVLFEIENSELRNYNNKKETAVLEGVVAKEPSNSTKTVKLTIETQLLNGKETKGKILITTYRYPQYRYGDKLKITGKLQNPPDLGDFNYADFLKKDGIYSVMSWPKIELEESGLGNPIMAALFSFKEKYKEIFQSYLSPPQLGIAEALIFGDESELSSAWKEKLNITGTRHIAAVSGMNITIISVMILSSFLALGLWRKQAFIASIIILILFILLIGAPASAVRAGIMAGILMIAQYFGRMSSANRAVLFAGFLMILQNPLILTLDIGFQLSFLAILGLVNLQPFLLDFLRKIPEPVYFPIRTALSATMAAQIFTLPILIYNFGRIPIFSLLSNILIVPFLAPLTVFLIFFGLSGIIFSFLAQIISWPAWLFLTYIVFLIEEFAKLPFAAVNIENVHWIWLIISYLVLIVFVRYLQDRQRFRIITP